MSVDSYLTVHIPRRRIYDRVHVVSAYDTRLKKKKNIVWLNFFFFFLYVQKEIEKSHLRGKGGIDGILDGFARARDKSSACHAEFILVLFHNGFLSQTLSTRCNSTQFPDSACIPSKAESGSQNISSIRSCKSIFSK